MLDFGCGSGILALAALKLGAARAVLDVVGVDQVADRVANPAADLASGVGHVLGGVGRLDVVHRDPGGTVPEVLGGQRRELVPRARDRPGLALGDDPAVLQPQHRHDLQGAAETGAGFVATVQQYPIVADRPAAHTRD